VKIAGNLGYIARICNAGPWFGGIQLNQEGFSELPRWDGNNGRQRGLHSSLNVKNEDPFVRFLEELAN